MTFYQWIEYHIWTELLKLAAVFGFVLLVILGVCLYAFIEWLRKKI